jgi:predicted enzyme related to lactoylglutathione lyase
MLTVGSVVMGASDVEAEVERLLSLGATRVEWTDYPPGSDFTVLADTEGNRFRVIDTSGRP